MLLDIETRMLIEINESGAQHFNLQTRKLTQDGEGGTWSEWEDIEVVEVRPESKIILN